MSSTYDFGRGPVPAHRHPNGGGWVADTATVHETAIVHETASVGEDCTIGPYCYVGPGCELHQGCELDPYCTLGQGCKLVRKTRTQQPLHITKLGDQQTPGWTVCATASHLQIGCQLHTWGEWMGYRDYQIEMMHRDALPWWRKYRPVLEAHRATLDPEYHGCAVESSDE